MRIALLVCATLAFSGSARADDPPSQMKEAGQHFNRGVSLFDEADYRAALVEFKRAYQIAPNATVLYNIGQTQYQLQNYASALKTFERYLDESGPTAAHRDEVTKTLETLRSRVGKVAITTNVPGCEITVDDELVGKTPMAEPALVSVGHRKIVAMHGGYQAETKFVDVAAGDVVMTELSLAQLEGGKKSDADLAKAVTALFPQEEKPKPSRAKYAWVAAGVLGGGAAVTGFLAWRASDDLATARKAFPADPADLASRSSKVKSLSLAADILGGAAVVAGGIGLYLTLSHGNSHEVRATATGNGVALGGTFR